MDNNSDNQKTELVITIPEMGQRLKVTRDVAYRLARSEGFPVVHIGKRLIIPVKELEQWLSDQVKKQKGDPK